MSFDYIQCDAWRWKKRSKFCEDYFPPLFASPFRFRFSWYWPELFTLGFNVPKTKTNKNNALHGSAEIWEANVEKWNALSSAYKFYSNTTFQCLFIDFSEACLWLCAHSMEIHIHTHKKKYISCNPLNLKSFMNTLYLNLKADNIDALLWRTHYIWLFPCCSVTRLQQHQQ